MFLEGWHVEFFSSSSSSATRGRDCCCSVELLQVQGTLPGAVDVPLVLPTTQKFRVSVSVVGLSP